MDLDVLHSLRGIGMEALIIKTVFALLVGGILGVERGRKRRPAGFRTFMLVCFGSMAVMVTNQYVYTYFKTGDPLRMAAQVVSGIGFLGAGTIITTSKSQISGITTAASLWTAACLGLAIGIGFYELSVIGLFVVLLITSGLNYVDNYLMMHSRFVRIYLEFDSSKTISSLLEFGRNNLYEIRDLQVTRNKINKEIMAVILLLRSQKKRTHSEMIQEWQAVEGVEFIEEID